MTTQFGLMLPHFGADADKDRLVAGARLADDAGFDSLWVRDHLVFHPHAMEGTDNRFIEPLAALNFVAGATSRIALGTATIIPVRHPIGLAQAVSSLSWLSGRPIDLGIGSGNFQHEFDVIGLGDVDRVDMMRQQAAIIRRLWSGEPVSWHSDLYDFDDVSLSPKPAGPIPLWWGGATPASTRLAVEFCEGWLPGRINFQTYELRVAKLREMASEQGKPMVKTGALPLTTVARSRAEAIDPIDVPSLIKNANAQRFWVKPESGEFTTFDELEGSILAGSPEDIVAAVRRYQEIGCDLLVFDLRLRFADWENQIGVLADKVLPKVREPLSV